MSSQILKNRRKNSISKNLIDLREKLGYNKNQFANFLGIGNSYISKYEKGVSDPGAKFLILLKSKIPKLDLNWLIMGEGSMFISEMTNPQLYKENEKLKDKLEKYEYTIKETTDKLKKAMGKKK